MMVCSQAAPSFCEAAQETDLQIGHFIAICGANDDQAVPSTEHKKMTI
jgi:hypothetical protein